VGVGVTVAVFVGVRVGVGVAVEVELDVGAGEGIDEGYGTEVGVRVGRSVREGTGFSTSPSWIEAGVEAIASVLVANAFKSTAWRPPQADRLRSPAIKSIHLSMSCRPKALTIALRIDGSLSCYHRLIAVILQLCQKDVENRCMVHYIIAKNVLNILFLPIQETQTAGEKRQCPGPVCRGPV
jgi:hypothetical protein